MYVTLTNFLFKYFNYLGLLPTILFIKIHSMVSKNNSEWGDWTLGFFPIQFWDFLNNVSFFYDPKS